MTINEEYRNLLRRSLIVAGSCILAVIICYFWVDRSVAFFLFTTITSTRLKSFTGSRIRRRSAELVGSGVGDLDCSAGVGTIFAMAKGAARRLYQLDRGRRFRISLGDVFGRYWPETWRHDNPSLIGTGTYGFHRFSEATTFGSFPSGHACRIFGFAGVWMMAMPGKSRGSDCSFCTDAR